MAGGRESGGRELWKDRDRRFLQSDFTGTVQWWQSTLEMIDAVRSNREKTEKPHFDNRSHMIKTEYLMISIMRSYRLYFKRSKKNQQ